MDTQITTVGWHRPLSLNPSPIIFDIPYQKVSLYPPVLSNRSFLHDSIQESKKVFLSHSLNDEKPEDEQMEEKSLIGQPDRKPCKKISFKIKKQSSLYRRNATPNKVAELTKKFNEMVEKRNFWEEEHVKRILKRVESGTNVKITRKPSVKTKPNLVIIKTVRKNSVKVNARASEETAARPKTLNLDLNIPKAIIETSPNGTSVKAAIEIFEKKSSPTGVPKLVVPTKPIVPEKSAAVRLLANKTTAKQEFEDRVPVINIPAVLPQRRCDSMYETMTLKKILPQPVKAKSVDNICEVKPAQPNTSFLWRDKSPSSTNSSRSSIYTQKEEKHKVPIPDDYEEIGNLVEVEETFKSYDEMINSTTVEHYEEVNKEEKIYEELSNKMYDGYEPIGNQQDVEYEGCPSPKTENIYETLPVPPVPLRRPKKQEPLPPRPPSTAKNEDGVYNCYESIYPKKDSYYESIYGSQLTTDSGSNRDSMLSSHKSNSLYGHCLPRWDSEGTYYKPPSDISDRSDEWEDVTDNEEGENRIIVVRERPKSRKPGWSQHFRDQLSKNIREINGPAGEDDHLYESVATAQQAKEEEDFYYDSFESDSESEGIVDDSGIDISNNRLPDPPNNQSYRLMKFAEKNMKKIRRNFTMNITKSLTRMKKHMSKTDNDISVNKKHTVKPKLTPPTYENIESTPKPTIYTPVMVEPAKSESPEESKTLQRNSKGGFLNKFRRSMSLSADTANEITSNLSGNRTKSTFYLTDTIDVDSDPIDSSDKSLSPVLRQSKSPIMRPSSPPPPAPVLSRTDLRKSDRKDGKASSWYADSGVFRNNEVNQNKRPNTFWYAEVGLYRGQDNTTPSTSSAENSGSNLSTPIKPFEIPRPLLKPSDFINQDDQEKFNNLKNEDHYYTDSVDSFSSFETKKDDDYNREIQLRLQDEPLYQFYDAAVLESINYSNTSDFDSDNYEDVSDKELVSNVIKIRPSAMELVSPKRNSICFNKHLWCEIPEVINSSVLSTLSAHQKKLQEAKFEIITSEASYLNSLNVLYSHFVKGFCVSNVLSDEEKRVLFEHVEEVRNCSEKLLHDLEKCWQDNILLHGICDIIQKHAEESFRVYIPYCENQVLYDETLKILKERLGFTEFLKLLESNQACQSLSLYSFLMLPMQRITRWPLLVDAVLKRLSQQDSEYPACQLALATVNKIVSQCNEAARNTERATELHKLSKQLDFPNTISKIPIVVPERYLVRCGSVVHMQNRNDDTKLTFGKRFSKSVVYLFLFNDLFVVAKEKGEKNYVVQQYCARNLVELSTSEVLLSVPSKEAQGKNLIFLTVLENQDGKTVEYLLSCSSESDKERWVEALTPRKSEDPEETLYECWDCPQVQAIHNYAACQPDELALSKGDVINVLRKMADGWYHGEKIRDGQTGWFPANHTVEIANIHVRARNLKQRYRFLAYSENYLKSK